MSSLILGGFAAFILSILGTPVAIRFFTRRGIGQEIRADGPTSHHSKAGTPTMGGIVIVAATVLGYAVAHLFVLGRPGRGPSAAGLLVLGLFVLLGAVGFVDDYIKVRKRRSLGLNETAKLTLQLTISVVFAVLALHFRNKFGMTPGSTHISVLRDVTWLSIGGVGFVILAVLIISATSNAVNLTDGLDGLATGTSVMVFIAYALIAFWQFRHQCGTPTGGAKCYLTPDSLDVSMVAFAAAGACFGFLWWNASPARIFMGDTGSLALGGLLAGLAMVTRTELLLVVLGALFVIITMSVIIQVGFFKMTGRRVFRMAPLQHHFELAGWGEVTIVIRFWIIAGIGVATGLGLFYADFLVGQ